MLVTHFHNLRRRIIIAPRFPMIVDARQIQAEGRACARGASAAPSIRTIARPVRHFPELPLRSETQRAGGTPRGRPLATAGNRE
jgi:hypothetical protein